jgi:hypothetical protein
VQAVERLRETIDPAFPNQHLRLHQGADALLQKEGITASAGAQEPRERRQTGIVPEQGVQERLGTHGWQRVEAQLRVIRFAAPAVLVVGAVIDQEQEPRRWQALNQRIE